LQQNLAAYHPTAVVALTFLQILRKATLRGLAGFNLPLIKFGALSKLLFVGRNGKSSKDDGAEIFKMVVKETGENIKLEKEIFVQVGGGREGGEGAWRVGGRGCSYSRPTNPRTAIHNQHAQTLDELYDES